MTEKFYSDEDWFHNKVYKPEVINTTEDNTYKNRNDNILENAESKKRTEFILSEYEAEDLLSDNTTSQKLNDFLDEYNWDDGLEVPYYISKHKNCDLGTAMKLFYLADGLGILSEDFEESTDLKWVFFVKMMYKQIQNGEFREKNSSYIIPLSNLQKKRVKNKFFTRQVCAASSTNIGTLAVLAKKARSMSTEMEGKLPDIFCRMWK